MELTPQEVGFNLLTGDPLLAPLGDFGGFTQTAPPLPGSPAIDPAGSVTNPGGVDQRGFTRFVNGSLDIGAVELQEGEEITVPGSLPFPVAEFALDQDQDGTPNGLEFILGTDFATPDIGSPRNPTIAIDSDGNPVITFGLIELLPDTITLRIMRSPDLSPNSFTEISSITTDSDITLSDGLFSFIDDSSPSLEAFYRLEAVFDETS